MSIWSERYSVGASGVVALLTIGLIASTTTRREAATAHEVAKANLDNTWTIGSHTARIVVVEYSDFSCSFCIEFARETRPILFRDFVNRGLVLWGFRHFVGDDPAARLAAVACECAGAQGAFWRMYDAMFQAPGKTAEAQLVEPGRELGLNLDSFGQCMSSPEPQARLSRESAEAVRLGLYATPSFLIGVRDGAGEVTVRHTVSGGMSASVFSEVLALLVRTEGPR